MNLQKVILTIVLSIEMFFVKFFSIKKDRITFISLEGKMLTSDMKLIYDKLDKNYDIRLCLMHYQRGLYYQAMYFLNCLKQLYLVNTSRIVLLHDNNYVVSNFKREGVHVIQLWHAVGAIKKFGNAIERTYKVENYDMVPCTSEYWKEAYSEAFNISVDQVLPLGMARCDELFNKQWCEATKERLLTKYPNLRNKKIIVYAPTFRGDIYQGFRQIPIDTSYLMNQLGDDYILIYKFHPLVGNYKLSEHTRVINMNHEDTHQLFALSDLLITDYSSIFFDYLILDKPIVFFAPDYDEYMKDRGMFTDIRELDLPICNNEDELTEAITHYSCLDKISELKDRYYTYQDSGSTRRIVRYIDDYLKNEA